MREADAAAFEREWEKADRPRVPAVWHKLGVAPDLHPHHFPPYPEDADDGNPCKNTLLSPISERGEWG